MEKVIKKGKKLQTGYTTGTCAQAAAKAAALYLFTNKKQDFIEVNTAAGKLLKIKIKRIEKYDDYAECSVIKESGDDPDVTNGIEIKAAVYKGYDKLIIDGGKGIGRVTKPGLKVPAGQAAINPVPRKMIAYEMEKICLDFGYDKSFKVIISAVEGIETAKKTFNEKLGIIGGISILGTTGIVEPMSEKALIDTIYLEIDSQMEQGVKNILLTPGNYGRNAALEKFGIDIEKGIKISNYIGDTLDYLLYKQPERILIIGHAGKLSKVAGGIMNTHSSYADCRHEIFASYAALCGAEKSVIEEIFNAVSTDEIDYIFMQYNLHEKVWNLIINKIMENINRRLQNKIKCEVMVFTNKENTWKYSSNALDFIKYFKDI